LALRQCTLSSPRHLHRYYRPGINRFPVAREGHRIIGKSPLNSVRTASDTHSPATSCVVRVSRPVPVSATALSHGKNGNQLD
jgi:hypothetical protein